MKTLFATAKMMAVFHRSRIRSGRSLQDQATVTVHIVIRVDPVIIAPDLVQDANERRIAMSTVEAYQA